MAKPDWSRRICTIKQAFSSPEAAERVRKRMARAHDYGITTYRCPRCRRWHVAHKD